MGSRVTPVLLGALGRSHLAERASGDTLAAGAISFRVSHLSGG